MSFFRRSSRRPEPARADSVQSFLNATKDDYSFVMKIQEENHYENEKKQDIPSKPSKLLRKKTSRPFTDLTPPRTANSIPIPALPEPPSLDFIYDVTIIGAGPAGLALA